MAPQLRQRQETNAQSTEGETDEAGDTKQDDEKRNGVPLLKDGNPYIIMNTRLGVPPWHDDKEAVEVDVIEYIKGLTQSYTFDGERIWLVERKLVCVREAIAEGRELRESEEGILAERAEQLTAYIDDSLHVASKSLKDAVGRHGIGWDWVEKSIAAGILVPT
ncbi:hypothetical protein HIM_05750 [Hirsutella minnesotensis 3608]|uniref:Uncharacterized protein n=1 Tax=Hirsutella minnesotensis 3608 TaxID=1043627 RepID=A0A0F7ZK04_9HYPO|nr:hypothetical protein HIM_05750 [Hirsutella minnesotensis 3608]